MNQRAVSHQKVDDCRVGGLEVNGTQPTHGDATRWNGEGDERATRGNGGLHARGRELASYTSAAIY